jgi:hypothetical protein
MRIVDAVLGDLAGGKGDRIAGLLVGINIGDFWQRRDRLR